MDNIPGANIPLLSHFPFAGLFLLIILGAVGLPFPEDATLILCGFLISHGAVKWGVALPAVYSAVLLGDLLIYAAGAKFGEKIITHRHFKKIISAERLEYLKGQFEKKGFLLLLFGRHIIGLRGQLLLVSGVMKMPVLKFIIADGVAALITVGLMAGVGMAGGNSLQIIRKDVARVEHAGILLLALAVAAYVLVRYFKPAPGKK